MNLMIQVNAKDLQYWVGLEGRAKTNLTAFIVETAVKNRFPTEYPPNSSAGNRLNPDKG